MIIREANVEDSGGIIQIINPIVNAGIYSALDTPFTDKEEREFISAFNPRGIFNVAEDEGGIVGFQTLEPFANYTHAFDHVGIMGTMVNLSKRRQGIGKLLSDSTFRIAKEREFEKIFTYVRADNEGAREFYQSLGFEIVGIATKQVKIRGKYIDEIVIEKFLD